MATSGSEQHRRNIESQLRDLARELEELRRRRRLVEDLLHQSEGRVAEARRQLGILDQTIENRQGQVRSLENERQHYFEGAPTHSPAPRALPTVEGFTYDARLQEFRKMVYGQLPEFVPLDSPRGRQLYAAFVQKTRGGWGR